MLSEEDMTLADEEIIYQAELQMYDACHLLNEYANREKEEKKSSIFFRNRLRNSLKICEESVKNMDFILMEINNKD